MSLVNNQRVNRQRAANAIQLVIAGKYARREVRARFVSARAIDMNEVIFPLNERKQQVVIICAPRRLRRGYISRMRASHIYYDVPGPA